MLRVADRLLATGQDLPTADGAAEVRALAADEDDRAEMRSIREQMVELAPAES